MEIKPYFVKSNKVPNVMEKKPKSETHLIDEIIIGVFHKYPTSKSNFKMFWCSDSFS